MLVEQLIQKFNESGVFPTDTELQTAIEGNPLFDSIYDLEMDLIVIAQNDTNHPYHSKVVGSFNFINF
jgi:hypothetical protein